MNGAPPTAVVTPPETPPGANWAEAVELVTAEHALVRMNSAASERIGRSRARTIGEPPRTVGIDGVRRVSAG
jgi:hypothetical protein